jgi:hypothetical protein
MVTEVDWRTATFLTSITALVYVTLFLITGVIR